MKFLWLEQTASTNSWLKENSGEMEPMTMVMAREQTAGRGQRGNSWEAEPGKNLTFSFYFNPTGIRPADQFFISEAVSLAIVSALEHYGIETKVKWPNDIYAGNRKICGILIENSILPDSIARTIAGIGLNVNQEVFVSDAPNPVSMTQLTGKGYDLEILAKKIGEKLEQYLDRLSDTEGLHREYKNRLWRKEGYHNYADVSSGEIFSAEIVDIESSGHLILQPQNDENSRRYAFKEVSFL